MNKKLFGFTLAEVLITLAIIGVVAALTLPTLIGNYKKHVVETRLAKFYSSFVQALNISESVNGNIATWGSTSVDSTDKAAVQSWQNKYITPYVNTLKIETILFGNNTYRNANWLPDGGLIVTSPTSTWLFFPEAKDFEKLAYEEDIILLKNSESGTKWFTFAVYKDGRGLQPYFAPNVEVAKNDSKFGCYRKETYYERAYCAYVIQQNGWKIPNDYPLRF